MKTPWEANGEPHGKIGPNFSRASKFAKASPSVSGRSPDTNAVSLANFEARENLGPILPWGSALVSHGVSTTPAHHYNIRKKLFFRLFLHTITKMQILRGRACRRPNIKLRKTLVITIYNVFLQNLAKQM